MGCTSGLEDQGLGCDRVVDAMVCAMVDLGSERVWRVTE